MKRLDSLEKHLSFLAVPNVILTLIAAQLVIYGAVLTGHVDYASVILDPRGVFSGEWWRLFSFLIAPPFIASGPIDALFLAFYWYILWMMSSSLESVWGLFRFNVFLFVGILLTIVGALLGQLISSNALIQISIYAISMSIFFAFATTHPNIEFLIMFILPVKVKWLAWFAGVIMLLSFIGGPTMGHRLAILAPVLNYLLFFWGDLVQITKSHERRKKFDVHQKQAAEEALHICSICGTSDQSDPDRDFRYKVVDDDTVCVCAVCRDNA